MVAKVCVIWLLHLVLAKSLAGCYTDSECACLLQQIKKSVTFIKPNHKWALRGFTICTAYNILDP